MPKDIREYYTPLGLNPGASLDEIKLAYRQMLQRWHPDHFKPGSVMQTTAEDVTKEVNEAYEQLCKKKRYLEFRKNVRTPGPEREKRAAPEPWTPPVHRARRTYEQAANVTREKTAPPKPPEPKRPSPPRAARPAPPPPPRRQPSPPVRPHRPPRRRFVRWRLGSWRAWLLALATLSTGAAMLATLRFVRVHRPETSPRNAPSEIAAATPPRKESRVPPVTTTPAARPVEVETRPPLFEPASTEKFVAFTAVENRLGEERAVYFAPAIAESSGPLDTPVGAANSWRAPATVKLVNDAIALLDTFELGDSKAKVLAVQGRPDEAGENIFRYGSSLVYFRDGRVTNWYDGRPSLRVFILPTFDVEGVAAFTVGSTKSEVIRIQGLPTNTTRAAFYYGASVVYFDREWVTSWTEVDQRLHARLLPTVPFGSLEQFAAR